MRVKRFLGLFKEALAGWLKDDGFRLAAAVAFYAIFSIIPLLLFALGLLGVFLGEQAAKGEILRTLQQYTSTRAAESAQTLIVSAYETRGDVWTNVIGFMVLFFGASGVFFQLKWALNRMWGVPSEQTTGVLAWIRSRLVALAMVIGTTLFLVLTMVTSSLLAGLEQLVHVPIPGGTIVWRLVTFVVFLTLLTLVFALIFKYVPSIYIEWRKIWIPAAVTSAMFSIGQLILSTFIGRSGFATVYGAAGSLVIVMLWVYFTAMVILYGAEFSQAYARRAS